jgi:MFS family permease
VTDPAVTARWLDLVSPALAPRAALVVLGVWLNAADALVTATIMPSVAHDLGGAAYFGWAVALYLTGSILAGASTGQLSRRLGLRPAMIIAALAYAAGCGLSAASSSIDLFLLGRVLQGVGAGWLVGFCYVAIGMVFPEALWARMFGTTAGVWGVASILGPLIGGVFASAGHWRGAFWMFAGQGALFAVACLLLLPARRSEAADVRPLAWRTLTVLGAAILIIAAADVIGGIVVPAVLLAAGAALLIVAGWINAAPGERLLPPEAANPATIAGAGYAMILAMEVATVVINVYEAAILQSVYRVSPLVAGYAVSVMAVGWTAAAFLVSGQPERRHGAFIIGGGVIIVIGCTLMAMAIARWPLGWIVAAGAVIGVGFGLSWSLVTGRILRALPEDDRAIGSAAVPTTQLIGGAVGAAAAGAVANLLALPQTFTPAHVAATAPTLFGVFVPVAGLGLLAAVRLALSVVPLPPGSRSDDGRDQRMANR